MTYKNVCRLSAVFFLLAAIFTRVYIWTANPKAIWLDEAMLSAAIWRDAWATVLKGQLDFFQSAPLGFLALTKLLAIFSVLIFSQKLRHQNAILQKNRANPV